MLKIEPTECLMDDLISIRITGLKPGQHVTLRCETIEQVFVYDSYAHFIASLDGEVDVSCDPSFGGSYMGVDAMGIFAHMLPASGQMKGLRYFPRQCMNAMEYKLQLYDTHLSEDNKFSKNKLLGEEGENVVPISVGVVLRRVNAKGVTRHEVRHGRVRGTIFQPPGPGPFKGVIDIYGGAGGINESRVAMLASHGFIAFTLPHHKYDDLPKNMLEMEVEYFLEAIEYFASLPSVQPNIGVMAVCAGGGIALHLSTLCQQISAMIVFGSPYTITVPLLYHGVPLDVSGVLTTEEFTMKVDKHGGFYREEVMNLIPHDGAATEIEKSNAKFLIVAGSDDKSMCAVSSGKYLVDRMKRFGQGDRITLLEYPGAGHFVDPPFMPKTLLQYYPEYKSCAAVGGTALENSIASVHCWRETLIFLNRNVGVQSKM